MKTQFVYAPSRAAATLIRLEMYTLEEYCRTGNAFLARKLRGLQKDVRENPSSYDDDQLVDLREELRIHTQYNTYFGELMAFAALERFLKHLYDHARRLAIRPTFRKVVFEREQRWVNFDQYKDFFGSLGIKLSAPPYKWPELKRLQAFRNAIAHQGGSVTSENVKALAPYKYQEGEDIDVSFEALKRDIQLVVETAEMLAEDFTAALEKIKKAKPKS